MESFFQLLFFFLMGVHCVAVQMGVFGGRLVEIVVVVVVGVVVVCNIQIR